MGLPQKIVDEYKPLVGAAYFFGQPISEFNRDELLAVIGYYRRYQESIEKSIKQEREMNRLFRQSLIGGRL